MSNTTTSERMKIDGITYDVESTGLRNAHSGFPMFSLTKIGKRGNPTKQFRPALLRPDGSWHLGAWCRL